VRSGPDPVLREAASLVLAEADVVERGEDEPRDTAPFERHLRGLLRAEELRDDAEVELLVSEPLAERARLLPSGFGERHLPPWVAVRQSVDRGQALGVAG
jgi:hypothetical protein